LLKLIKILEICYNAYFDLYLFKTKEFAIKTTNIFILSIVSSLNIKVPTGLFINDFAGAVFIDIGKKCPRIMIS